MSYEGYEQLLCKNGHYHTADCRDDGMSRDPNCIPFNSVKCPDCGAEFVWMNSVDDTNCDEQGYIDIDLFQIRHAVFVTTPKGREIYTEAVYRIPSKEETHKARLHCDDTGHFVPIEE